MSQVSEPAELADGDVDALEPERGGADFVVRGRAPDRGPAGLRVLQDLTTIYHAGDLRLLASGVADGADGTRVTDTGGLRVDGDVVEAWNAGGDRVRASRAAVARLFARLAAAAADTDA